MAMLRADHGRRTLTSSLIHFLPYLLKGTISVDFPFFFLIIQNERNEQSEQNELTLNTHIFLFLYTQNQTNNSNLLYPIYLWKD